MFDGGFSEEGSTMEDIFPGGEEFLDSTEAWPMWTDQKSDVGEEIEIDTDANEEELVSDAMILDAMEAYVDLSHLEPPQFPGGLPIEDVSATPQTSTTPVPHDSSIPQPTSQPREPLRDLENDDIFWKRFDILPSAPTDHAFYDRSVPQPSRAFMARLHKEYIGLSTGLPGTLI
jgi:ubiquitin-conjugating enzyme E2 O